jgi:hypothetical protein
MGIIFNLPTFGRRKIANEIVSLMYVDKAMGNSQNSGLTPADPLVDIQQAIYIAANRLDLEGNKLIIQVAPNVTPYGQIELLPHNGSEIAIVNGNYAGNQDDVILDGGAAAPTIQAKDVTSPYRFAGLVLQNTGSEYENTVFVDGSRMIFELIAFGDCGLNATHIAAINHANVSVLGARINLGAGRHLRLSANSICSYEGSLALLNTPDFGDEFANVAQASSLLFRPDISGTATGKHCNINRHGAIYTPNGIELDLPGNLTGTIDAVTYGLLSTF